MLLLVASIFWTSSFACDSTFDAHVTRLLNSVFQDDKSFWSARRAGGDAGAVMDGTENDGGDVLLEATIYEREYRNSSFCNTSPN